MHHLHITMNSYSRQRNIGKSQVYAVTLLVTSKVMLYKNRRMTKVKDGLEFAGLEPSAVANPAVMLSPAVAMGAEVHCQRPPAGAQSLEKYLHDASHWLVIHRR